MTPRRPVRAALTLVVGIAAAATLVGCGNGMQVAGPSDPHESVVSGRATPSAAGPDQPTPEPSADDQSPTPSAEPTDQDEPKRDGSGGGSADEKTSDDAPKHRKGSKHTKKSGDGHRSGSDDKSGEGSQDTSGSKDKSQPDPTTEPTEEPSDKPDSTPTTCTLEDLSIGARIPEGSGAAGSSYVLITFTNTSGSPCTMYGYAGVSFVGKKNGTQLGKPAARDRSASPEKVKLSDGEVQTELLRIANAGNFDPAECVPTTSDGFRVYPPSSYTSAYVKFETDVCQSKSVRQLTVYPVGTKS
ncbi:DUF4232 domain-containing protein [Microlunatus soli]|uniref:DUF4232 domain-containing protein n=1 Tax=Microlunatus soli TaxID=630515 RepID=A0A1H2AFB4_9ACTN|nr:DUF4232 domain-containing protein [Microlunatus soli]SDT44519.1 Protein of unknown function [Microlunatus soli]